MKRIPALQLTIVLIFSGLLGNAATLIVDSNFPRPTGVYATIQLAYNAATAGDTILISPSAGQYTGITISKKVHLVGTGWADISSTVQHTKTSSFTFNNGAQGSSITGLNINGLIDVNTSDITIKRNNCMYIYVRTDCTGISITQNIIMSTRDNSSTWNYASSLAIWPNCEVFVSNNVIINNRISSSYNDYAICTDYPVNVVITNNILKAHDYSLSIGMTAGGDYSSHRVFNNIVITGSIVGVSSIYDNNNHNIGNSTQFGTINYNQQNVTMNNVFVDADNYDFHLKESSPAIGTGFEGADCGIYDGIFPFVDNGRNWLPIITEIDVPTMINANDGLDISVKAKSGQ